MKPDQQSSDQPVPLNSADASEEPSATILSKGDHLAEPQPIPQVPFLPPSSREDFGGNSDEAGDTDPSTAGTLLSGIAAAGEQPALRLRVGGSLLGRFRILRLLGEGAFGAVYLADDLRLDRKVAIKIAKPGLVSGRDGVDRFLREARAAAQLRHPHIVPVYEVTQQGEHSILIYEFIEGQTLGSFLRDRGRLSPREAAQLLQKIAAALGYAHAHRIIHRDMKPENVLLDRDLEPHIADFGLARRDDQRTDATREGVFMGTPLYMSPEQAAGRSHEADARSDVWSLGVMFQQMLTGRLPFQGNVTQILVAVQNVEAPRLRTLDRRLPRDLETICEKCLAKNVEQRYQNAGELAEELDRWLRGEPIRARPIGVLGRTARWARRNPAVATLVAGICGVLLLGSIVSTYFAIQAERQAALVRQGQRDRALVQLQSLRGAVPASVPVLLEALRPVRDDVLEPLRDDLRSPDLDATARNRLRAALAVLAPEDPQARDELRHLPDHLLGARPEEAAMLVEVLQPFRDELTPRLRSLAEAPRTERDARFRALCALASLDPESALQGTGEADLVAGLVTCSPTDLASFLAMVRPLRDALFASLRLQLSDADQRVRAQAARVVALQYADQPELLYDLALGADAAQLPVLLASLREHVQPLRERLRRDLARLVPGDPVPREAISSTANLFVVGLTLAPADVAWSVLGQAPDKQLRTELIHLVPLSGAPWRLIAERLKVEQDPCVRVALLEILAGYPLAELFPGDRLQLRDSLVALARLDLDPGVHAAALWLLSVWGFGDRVPPLLSEAATPVPPPERQWHVDPAGHQFVVIDGPVEFLMGADPHDPLQAPVEVQHRRRIPRKFGIAMYEVTVAQYQQFDPDLEWNTQVSPELQCPVSDVSWFDAAKYCRWLSEQAGYSEDEMCFPPIDQIGPDMVLPADVLERPGYRLPTAAEWEYACRAGALTSRPFGAQPDCAESYVWFERNSRNRTWSVGTRMPNDFGLFDSHGNVLEWCQNWYFDDHPAAAADGVVIDGQDDRQGVYREVRGGAYDSPIELIRTPDRDYDLPFNRSFIIGFRLARTYPSQRDVEP